MKNLAILIVFTMLVELAAGKACMPESYGPCTSSSECCQDVTDWAGRKLGCYTHCSRMRCMTMKQCLFDSGVGRNWGRNNN